MALSMLRMISKIGVPTNIDARLKPLQESYTEQTEDSWTKLSGLLYSASQSTELEKPLVIFVILTQEAPQQFPLHLANKVSEIYGKKKVVLNGEVLNTLKPTEIIEMLNDQILKRDNRVVVIEDVNKIQNVDQLYVLHSLCDNVRPVYRNAFYIITIRADESDSQVLLEDTRSIDDLKDEMLHRIWEHMESKQRAALISRVSPVTIKILRDEYREEKPKEIDEQAISPIPQNDQKVDWFNSAYSYPRQDKYSLFERRWAVLSKKYPHISTASCNNMYNALVKPFEDSIPFLAPEKKPAVILCISSPENESKNEQFLRDLSLSLDKRFFENSPPYVNIDVKDENKSVSLQISLNSKELMKRGYICKDVDKIDNGSFLTLFWFCCRESAEVKKCYWIFTVTVPDTLHEDVEVYELLKKAFSQSNVDKFVMEDLIALLMKFPILL